jgi:hypothetical protein
MNLNIRSDYEKEQVASLNEQLIKVKAAAWKVLCSGIDIDDLISQVKIGQSLCEKALQEYDDPARVANQLTDFEKQWLLLAYTENDITDFHDRDNLFRSVARGVGEPKVLFRQNRTDFGRKVAEYLRKQAESTPKPIVIGNTKYNYGVYNVSHNSLVAIMKSYEDALQAAESFGKLWTMKYEVRKMV